ncbi:hypothetical protein OSB04_002992 [Centaurea solstitialis]|uniref:C2HC zinc finger plants domain-containing protein n=1 Tax=Centaurea solstitialis TaxID=347529 RepID=A0AA38U4G8_9ASTR|nr:hypothetical protein OSB04_002992 [Centaurea solstitialis]
MKALEAETTPKDCELTKFHTCNIMSHVDEILKGSGSGYLSDHIKVIPKLDKELPSGTYQLLESKLSESYKLLETSGACVYIDFTKTHNNTPRRDRYGNAMDAEMMESSSSSSSEINSSEVTRRLLNLARQLIHQGNPSQALQAVVTALRANGGEAAAFQALNRAKEVYQNKLRETNAANELASLFVECAIAEASKVPESNNPVADASGTSILAETGRKQVIVDAFSDGTSFICLQCGGLIYYGYKNFKRILGFQIQTILQTKRGIGMDLKSKSSQTHSIPANQTNPNRISNALMVMEALMDFHHKEHIGLPSAMSVIN